MKAIKIFLSVPFRGRKEKDILFTIDAMTSFIKNTARETNDKREIIIVHNYSTNDISPKGSVHSLWNLGNAMQKISLVNQVVYVNNVSPRYRGCEYEKLLAGDYDIPLFGIGSLATMCPDLCDKIYY